MHPCAKAEESGTQIAGESEMYKTERDVSIDEDIRRV